MLRICGEIDHMRRRREFPGFPVWLAKLTESQATMEQSQAQSFIFCNTFKILWNKNMFYDQFSAWLQQDSIEIHEISVGVNEVFKLCSQVIIREDTVSHTFFWLLPDSFQSFVVDIKEYWNIM